MLEISRTLETDIVIEYEKPFLPLPAQNYLKLMGMEPNRPQIAMINALNDPRFRFITACVSRRVGKTFIANIMGQLVSFKPGTNVLIIAPDYTLAAISWDLQRSLLDKFDVEREKDNAKDRVIQLINGSTIRIASVGRIDSAVGRSYDLIIFDEAAIADDAGKKFNISLRPTLDKLNSKCIFISTPRGDNWFKEYFDRGFDDQYPEWISIHADYRENPRVSEKDIEQARKEMSRAEFDQEYLALFVTFEGQIYNLKETQVTDLSEFIADLLENKRHKIDIIAGLDIGFRDHTAMCVIAVVPGDTHYEYYIIDEYMNQVANTETHAANIQDLINKYDIDFIFIDAAAAQTKFDLASMYDISTINAIKSVNDGISCVSAIVDNDRLYVHEECVESVYALRNYRWKQGVDTERPDHTRANHMADAIRYAIYTSSGGMGGAL